MEPNYRRLTEWQCAGLLNRGYRKVTMVRPHHLLPNKGGSQWATWLLCKQLTTVRFRVPPPNNSRLAQWQRNELITRRRWFDSFTDYQSSLAHSGERYSYKLEALGSKPRGTTKLERRRRFYAKFHMLRCCGSIPHFATNEL